MAANQVIDRTPTPLAGLELGQQYFIQNTGKTNVYVQLGTSAPTDTDSAFKLQPCGTLYAKRTSSSEDLYVWTTSVAGSRLVYENAS